MPDVDVMLLLKAALIGLSIAAPVGPIGLLCMQRTLAHGGKIGFVSGLGAAVADGVYGAIGAFGLAAITQFLVTLAVPLAIGGAAFLGGMGIQMLRASVADGAPPDTPDAVRPVKAFGSVFALTLANPMTILSFIAVFAAIGGGQAGNAGGAGTMVLGVFAGSALWWLTLAFGVAALRHKISRRVMSQINRLAGTFLLAFAVWQLAGLFY